MNKVLYRKVMGADFDQLPEQVQKLHGSGEQRCWSGQVEARAGRNVFARLAAKVSGFPTKDFDGPVSVMFTPDERGELWERDFGGYKFHTYQIPGQGRNDGLLVEQFGAIHVALAVVVRDGRLYLIPRRWTFLGGPLPKFLLPGGGSFEYEADGRFHFDVAVHLPLIGQIVGYRGWLMPDDQKFRENAA